MSARPKEPTPRHILFLSSSSVVWGAEKSLTTLLTSLVEQNLICDLACPPGELADVARAHVNRLIISEKLAFPGPPLAGLRTIPTRTAVSWLMSTRRELDLFANWPYDVWHSFSLNLTCSLASVRRRPPTVFDLHDVLHSRANKVLLRAALRPRDRLLSVSRYVAREAQLAGRAEIHSRPFQVPSWTDQLRARPKSSLRILIAGRLDPEKRIGETLRAMRGVGGVEVHVVGDPSEGHERYADTLRREIDLTTAEGPTIVWKSRVRDLHHELSLADIVICPNPREPLGRTVIEGQSFAKVVMVPSTGGARELVDDGRTGFLYDETNFGQVLRTLVDNFDLRKRVGLQSRDHAERYYSPELYGRNVSQIYSAMCSGNGQ